MLGMAIKVMRCDVFNYPHLPLARRSDCGHSSMVMESSPVRFGRRVVQYALRGEFIHARATYQVIAGRFGLFEHFSQMFGKFADADKEVLKIDQINDSLTAKNRRNTTEVRQQRQQQRRRRITFTLQGPQSGQHSFFT